MEREELRKLVKEENVRKIFEKVFDRQTIMTVHTLAKRGYFDVLEYVISTGKEAHVFRCHDGSGNFRAVKIYKIETSEFRNLEKYLFGDERFKSTKKTKKDIVFAWAKKEFKNLELCQKAKASAPRPMISKNNVLVMDFVGENGNASPTLKETDQRDKKTLEDFYVQVVEFIARLLYLKELIHADLSEYNILVKGKKLVVIDVGQGVLTSHPNAKEFFERDVKNMANYFARQGLEKTYSEMIEDIKAKGKSLQNGK